MVHPQHITSAITEWIGPVRWHLGESTDLTARGYTTLHSDQDGIVIWMVVRDGSIDYNVPLVLTQGTADAGTPAVGHVDGYDIFDAADHPLGQRVIFSLLTSEITPGPEEHWKLTGKSLHLTAPTIRSAHKLTSEQSNTSIIYELDDSKKLILKVFRVLAPGYNPDVELQQALDGTGTVPGQYGSVTMGWDQAAPKVCEGPGRRRADVVVAQEFVEGAHDAWQVMTESLAVSDGTLGNKADSIRGLGQLTRRIHTELAHAFPPVAAGDVRRAEIVSSWHTRAAAAIQLVPSLESLRGAIDAAYEAAAGSPWPDLQRIHGDYHLGQVVEVPGRGWFALDFEGEPLRPLNERTGVDLALRDVAGMLRSFDYAAGSAELAGGNPEVVHAWAKAAGEAFREGYGPLPEDQEALLRALVIDKALYEVSYEAAERPTWLSVPVTGLERILSHVS